MDSGKKEIGKSAARQRHTQAGNLRRLPSSSGAGTNTPFLPPGDGAKRQMAPQEPHPAGTGRKTEAAPDTETTEHAENQS